MGLGFDRDRRAIVMNACRGAAAAPLLAALVRCQAGVPPPRRAQIAWDRLPSGRRVVVDLGDWPVEVLRQGEQVTARSLLCTHQGCRVRWSDEKSLYECPCHKAAFDAAGRVVFGPALKPLPAVPARREADLVLVGE